MTDYFNRYSSNTCAGSGNQLYFSMEENEIRTGRVLYKIFAGGEYNYSLLFSNIIDSTYADGSKSYRNLICDSLKIHSARIGRCRAIPSDKHLSEMTVSDAEENILTDITVSDFKPVTFNKNFSKDVAPGEIFTSDALKLHFDKDEYLCLEITFSGKMIPYHEETLLPVFIKGKSGWEYSKLMPFAGMIGCDRNVNGRISYFGDSITQGIGVRDNSYLHWTALLSEKIGADYSHWNLGIGYGRANDAASDGVWLYKASQSDIIFVCYGVNDILQNQTEEQIISDLKFIAEYLKTLGKKVIFQTIPPFNYTDEAIKKWERINHFIMTEIKETVDFVFDVVPYLGEQEHPYNAKFGGHPNEEGCTVWADALFSALKEHFPRNNLHFLPT